MKVIRTRNVHQALPLGLSLLNHEGVQRDSRNGPVLVFPEPVTTVYERPAERVVFWPSRDANPFFHLMESLWMLAGRNDVEYVAQYVQRMRSFSDDGVTFHGAYGYRWRQHFDFDQLRAIIKALSRDKDCRRQVLSMWDARADLGREGKDLPCNLQAVFQIATDGRLDMMVTNRSNDIVWGAYGANAVHFSYLHEFVARAVGVEQGVYRQVSANLHGYVAVLDQVKDLPAYAPDPLGHPTPDPYVTGLVEPFPLMTIEPGAWMDELLMFLSNPEAVGFRDPFFRRVAVPMHLAHEAYKRGSGETKFTEATVLLKTVAATDWQLAAADWIDRRWERFQNRKRRTQDDGVAYD